MKDNIKAKQNAPLEFEEIYEFTILLDFYGQLLTQRQFDIMDDYYNSDFSLGEISENLGISRQGVYDSIRKAKNTLVRYEKKLGLVERFSQQENRIKQALENLKKMAITNLDICEDENYKAAVELLTKLFDTL